MRKILTVDFKHFPETDRYQFRLSLIKETLVGDRVQPIDVLFKIKQFTFDIESIKTELNRLAVFLGKDSRLPILLQHYVSGSDRTLKKSPSLLETNVSNQNAILIEEVERALREVVPAYTESVISYFQTT